MSDTAERSLDRVWFNSRQAADFLGYESEVTVLRAYRDGRLKGTRTPPARPGGRGGNPRFHRDWLNAFAHGEEPTAGLVAIGGRR